MLRDQHSGFEANIKRIRVDNDFKTRRKVLKVAKRLAKVEEMNDD